MSTSDRVCPTHGDIGALPSHNNCSQCGAQLVMKSHLRSAAENVLQGAAIGFGVGIGVNAAESVFDSMSEGIGGITDIL